MVCPIMIPSKERSHVQLTAAALAAEGIPFEVAVEPQELEKYRATGYPVFDIGDNDRGLSYSRWACLREMRRRGEKWFWMLDDDLKRMGIAKNGELVEASFSDALTACESFISVHPKIAIVGMGCTAFAKFAKRTYSLNRYVATVMLIRTDTPADYKSEFELYEDAVFMMESFKLGYLSLIANRVVAFAGKRRADGGCAVFYRGAGAELAAKVVDAYHPYLKLVEHAEGAYDVKLNTRLIDRDFGIKRKRRTK